MLDDDFFDKMIKISPKHGFWAKMIVDAFAQEDSDHDTLPIVTNLNNSKATSKGCDPFRAATKGFCDAWPPNSGPAIYHSCVGKSHKVQQAKVKEFFYPDPTPVHPLTIEEDGDDKPEVVFVRSTDATSNKTSAAAAASATTSTAAAISTATAASASATTAGGSTVEHPRKEFYDQLIAIMKNFAAPQHQQKIVVELREHNESVDLAKLQTSMLRLMYVSREIDWDEGTVKNIQLPTFQQGFKSLIDRSAMVQANQLANLFTSIFSTKADNDDDDSHLNTLNRLLSLFVFTPKFTKAHLNASF
jgi:hypothetical protein